MIERFRDENFFLSNMYPLRVPIFTSQGVEVRTAEHRYQAEKFRNELAHYAVATICIDDSDPHWKDGVASKQLAHWLAQREGLVRPDWHDAKFEVMEETLWSKFTVDPLLTKALLATKGRPLVEGNDWGDRVWGVSPPPSEGGRGQNHLGRMLMELRDVLEVGAMSRD